MGHLEIQVKHLGNLSQNTKNFKYWQLWYINCQFGIQLKINQKGGGTLEVFECNEVICIVMCNKAI